MFLIFIIVGYRRKFINDENFQINGNINSNSPPDLQKPLKRILVEDVGWEESLQQSGDVAKQTQLLESMKPEEDSQGTAAVADNIPDREMTSDGRMFLDTETSARKPEGSSGVLAPKKSDGSRDTSTSTIETGNETYTQFKAASSSFAAAPAGVVVAPPGRLPSVPETSLQFQTDWKTLKKGNGALLSQYFEVCIGSLMLQV